MFGSDPHHAHHGRSLRVKPPSPARSATAEGVAMRPRWPSPEVSVFTEAAEMAEAILGKPIRTKKENGLNNGKD